MKKNFLLSLAFSLIFLHAFSQTEDIKTLQETARTFMRSGDYNNAIVVLNRALNIEKDNLELQKDLVLSYYLKKDYIKALEGVKAIVDRNDADIVTYQIAGNVYKALEQAKDCEKLYKKGLKKFPKSGALYSEYGELLWATKDFSAIDQWEKGIETDPAYSGNYYNAALFYYYTKDKIWGLLYGEIFVNMESLSERGAAMKQLLLQGYKEKLFADANMMTGQENLRAGKAGNLSEFAKAVLQTMSDQSSLAAKGITTETLAMIRARFILEWYNKYAAKFPFRLFDFQRQLMQEGMFNAYNQWLFGTTENLTAYDNWTRTHPEENSSFTAFRQSRIFRMPPGQYYRSK